MIKSFFITVAVFVIALGAVLAGVGLVAGVSSALMEIFSMDSVEALGATLVGLLGLGGFLALWTSIYAGRNDHI